MYTLLPQSERKKIVLDYGVRFSTVLLSATALAVVIAGILLLPSYFLSHTKYQNVTAQHEAVKLRNVGSQVNYSEIVKETKNNIKLFSEKKNVLFVENVMAILMTHKPKSVSITNMRLSRSADNTTLSIQGVAVSREGLTAFVRALQSESLFSKVDLPISNLVKSKDIPFEIALAGKF